MNKDGSMTFSAAQDVAHKVAAWLLQHHVSEWLVTDDTGGTGSVLFTLPASAIADIVTIKMASLDADPVPGNTA